MANKNQVVSNLIWRFLERFGAQGVTLIVSIVLARVLDPVVYGSVALITVITTILQVFVDSGLGSALIQKKDADDVDFSTVFYFNFAVCIVLYVGLFFAAPLIAEFYGMTDLTPVIRVLGLILIVSGFKNIQNAYVSRHLQFKKYFFATLGGTVTAAVVGIWMAYSGFGVWALVAQNLVNQAIDTLILWLTVKWRPKFVFSFNRLKGLLKFGWKLLVSSLLDTVWNELRQLIIGKQYTSEDLAFYNKGNEYPKHGATALDSAIDSVMLPVMAQAQNDREKVKMITRRAIQTCSFILWPMMIGLAACSKSFVSFFLTDKWLPAVPYLQIFCIVYAFYPIATANLNAIKAVGRSDIFLIQEIIKKIVNLAIILTTMWFGVLWMALGSIIGSVCSQIINSFPNKKLLGYSYLEQLKDILPSIALSLIMGACVLAVNLLGLSAGWTLLVQIPLGVLLYVAGAVLFKMEPFYYCLGILKGFFNKKSASSVNTTGKETEPKVESKSTSQENIKESEPEEEKAVSLKTEETAITKQKQEKEGTKTDGQD